jgi:hypothetical protein
MKKTICSEKMTPKNQKSISKKMNGGNKVQFITFIQNLSVIWPETELETWEVKLREIIQHLGQISLPQGLVYKHYGTKVQIRCYLVTLILPWSSTLLRQSKFWNSQFQNILFQNSQFQNILFQNSQFRNRQLQNRQFQNRRFQNRQFQNSNYRSDVM